MLSINRTERTTCFRETPTTLTDGFLEINNRHQIMASISSIDIDETSSKVNISDNSFNAKLLSMEKHTVLKAFVGIIIGLTFLLACIALG